MTKEEKAEYDRKYRLKNKERIKARKKTYNESNSGREVQKRAREKRKGYHKEYCKKPEQRKKEKERRHIREGQNLLKFCIVCEKSKKRIDFIGSRIYPDGKMYLCRDCENNHRDKLGVSTKSVIQALVTNCNYKLSREDFAKHPYFVEAKKYSIILNKLIK